jgi:Tol biopolymer transport system component
MALHFDLRRLETTGEAFPIGGNIDQETPSAVAFVSVSTDGDVLLYHPASPAARQLTWLDRTGIQLGTVSTPGFHSQPRLSSDGKRLAIAIPDPESGNRDIWLVDMATGNRTRFTSNPANDWVPVWSPDGSRLAFASDRTPRSSIFRNAVSGGEEELLLAPPEAGGAFPSDWSRDGRFLLYQVDTKQAGLDIWLLSLTGDRTPRPWLVTEFNEQNARFSPDSKWIAYTSNESGVPEIYIRPLDKQGKQRVSTNGGSLAQWRFDGKELFYVSSGGVLMAATVTPMGETLAVSPAVELFRPCGGAVGNFPFGEWAADQSGKRFLFNCGSGADKREIAVAIHWQQIVKWP